jgi:SAM-dependent methyltransferase
LNSLELFNQIYDREIDRGYSKSLLTFFETTVRTRLVENPLVLDIGAGSKSIFEDTDLLKSNITAIDFSPVAIAKATVLPNEITYKEVDLGTLGVLENNRYDLVFDSHCLHCITDYSKRKAAFSNIYHSLKCDGIFSAEMMVAPVGKTIELSNKYVVDARTLEEEILSHGFKIVYFLIVRALVFGSDNGDCDLVRVILRK